MNRRDFIKVAVAGFGTVLSSGAAINMLNTKSVPETAPIAEAAPQAADGKQNVVVITGSPHKAGTSALLADKFIEGVQQNGHHVFRFNAAFEDIHPCRACNACNRNGKCILNDAIEQKLMPELLKADIIVLITPLYYYGMSTQLKTVLDRFYARTGRISGKQSVLLAAAGSDVPWAMDCLNKYYATLSSYMRWQNRGTVFAPNCKTRAEILKTNYPQAAYDLGYKL